MSFVYFVKHKGLDPIKIGWTSDIKGRLASFNCASPFGIILLGTISQPNAHLIEKQLHEKYASKRVRGEWFDISKEDVKAELYIHDEEYEHKLQRAILLMSEGVSLHGEHSTTQTRKEVFEYVCELLNQGVNEKRLFVTAIMEKFNVSRPTVFNWLGNMKPLLDTVIDVYKEGTVVHWVPKQQVIA